MLVGVSVTVGVGVLVGVSDRFVGSPVDLAGDPRDHVCKGQMMRALILVVLLAGCDVPEYYRYPVILYI